MEVMIDLETLGIGSKAPVISIGAVAFTKDGVVGTFYVNLDVKHQLDSGLRKVDASTIQWWMGQSDAARKVFKEEAKDTSVGLADFIDFINKLGPKTNTKVWGNGSTFDITIMESLFQDYKLSVPWQYNHVRDLRTFKEYIYDGKETPRVGTHHNALDDAMHQAQVVIDGLNKRAIVNKELIDMEISKPKKLFLKNSFAVFFADFKAKYSK